MAHFTPTGHSWKFFRTGELDQVALETAADLANLEHLDQKLWVALSCPVQGLELDERTLRLMDTDKDGRIRVPELLAAIKWASARLKDPGELLKGAQELPLASIDDATDEGRVLIASAQQVLRNVGKADAASISPADTADTEKIFAASPLNGDGVITPDATTDAEVQALIKDIIDTVGGEVDRTGGVGVTSAKTDAFFAELQAYIAWVEQSSTGDIAVLGDDTGAAVGALKAVRAKVEDYFARCRLAEFDSRALAALNREEKEFLAIAAKDLSISNDEIKGLPIARVEKGRALPLLEGVNPAWAGVLATLHKVAVAPVMGAQKTSLTSVEWAELNAKFAAYETWLGSKAGSSVEKLGVSRARALLASNARNALAELIARDKALEPEFKAITDVDKLTHYYRDMRTLLHNFVNFADFYSHDRYAVFQAGTLYVDSRSTELCIRVDAVSPLAAMSKAYIAYVDCKRAGLPPMKIAACITQGDSDYLFVGRNGIFYDRKGRDWDASISSIVDNPISIRQAFWSPYKKFLRMIEEQVAKRAAAAEAASSAKLASAADATANVDKNVPVAPAAAPKKIEIGTVAALGVAISGAVTALTLILGYVFGLKAWQYPLVVIGLMLVISTPSMIIAWLKLRQRTLGPILEGNGWAINGRVKINIPFGSALTSVAELPPGSRRSFEDPYEDKSVRRRRRFWTTLVVLVLIALGVSAWQRTWPFKPKEVETAAAPAAAPATP